MSGRADAVPRITDRRPKRLRRCLACGRRFPTTVAVRICSRCRNSRTALALEIVDEARVVIRGWEG